MPCSREEGEMGTQDIQNPLLARTTDTSLSLKDTSDIQTESSSRYTDERIQLCLRKTLNDQKSDPGLDTEGVHSMDTLKMDEPIALRTRHKFKLQYPSEPRKDTIRLDKTDTDMRELLICLIAQNKEQQVQIKAMNLMLKEVLAQQTLIVSKLHVTEAEPISLSKSKGKDSTHEETRKVVKPFGPRAELNKAKVRTLLPTSLDDSDATSHDSDNCSSLFYDNGGFDVPQSQISSQHDRGSSVVHGSTLQNYVYPIPKSPSMDASQETEASKINLDRSTENPRPSYARACMATPRKKHMDISDEFELFEAPSESPIPAESKRNPRPASYIKGRYIVPKAPKKVRDEAQEALTAALDQVPATIHSDQRGKRTTATLYVGNLEFKASNKDLKDALDAEFDEIRVENVVIPRKDGRSRGYAFVTLSWAQASKVDPSDICTFYSGMLYVKSRQIYLRELDSKNDTASSDDSVSSEYINNMDQMIEDLKRQIDENEQEIKMLGQQGAASIQ
jgi:hypothetical protein